METLQKKTILTSARNSRWIWTLLIGTMLTPFLLAWLLLEKNVLPTMNQGTFISPALSLNGVTFSDFQAPERIVNFPPLGKWSVMYVGKAPCHDQTGKVLEGLTRLHRALGKNQPRVQLAWLPFPTLSLANCSFSSTPFTAAWPALHLSADYFNNFFSFAEKMYIVDPQGNLILQYEADNPDLRAILKDLNRLLKASRIG